MRFSLCLLFQCRQTDLHTTPHTEVCRFAGIALVQVPMSFDFLCEFADSFCSVQNICLIIFV